jgi:hypothetical protein
MFDSGGALSTLSNWGRWGPDDEAGTLNHVDGGSRVTAAGLVREGHTVSCSREIEDSGLQMVRGAAAEPGAPRWQSTWRS